MPSASKKIFPVTGEMLRNIFDSLSAHISIIDENGFIIETNRAWKAYSMENGLPDNFDFTQLNYLHVCSDAKGRDAEDGKIVAQGIRDVMEEKIDQFLYDYPCHSPKGSRWFYMRAILMDGADPLRVIISHEDITELKIIQEKLKEKETLLKDQYQSLEETNIALKVLLDQREKDKKDLEKKFLSNIKTFILPYVEKLKSAELSRKDKTLVRIVDEHLGDIISPLMQRLHNADVMLTPQEMQVAQFVKDGRTTSQIADIMFISEATVNFHRKNLRTKLGLKNTQKNLRSILISMS